MCCTIQLNNNKKFLIFWTNLIFVIMNISIKNNDHKLILLSESTIPVKNFQYIKNESYYVSIMYQLVEIQA